MAARAQLQGAARTRPRASGSLGGRSHRAVREPSRSAVASSPGEQVVEIQRTRLLGAAVRTIDELGYAHATVAHITRRARVSRRTFYELFADREQCLIAVFDGAVQELRGELAAAGLQDADWRERVRGGLAAILAFLDREPALARVCVVQALRAGPAMLERREQVLAALALVVDEGRTQRPHGGERTALAAEGLVGATFAIVHARLLRGETEPLGALLGELMGMIVLPYLGPAAARREQRQSLFPPVREGAPAVAQAVADPLAELPMRVTYRTARMLGCVAEHAGASNRLLSDCAEIHDQGQVSKLLARLQRLGLLENRGERAKGEPNSWSLTPLGQQLTRKLKLQDRDAPVVLEGAS